MRSIKLVPALAAMATLFALAPAGASAAGHHGLKHVKHHAIAIRSGACHISVNAAPRSVTSGEPVVVFGQLRCGPGVSVASQKITILQRSAGAPGTSTVGTATTDATGHYQLPTAALVTNSTFSAAALGARGAHRTVRVAPKVTPTAPTPPDGAQLFTRTGPFAGLHTRRFGLPSTVTFAGSVSPSQAGATVVLQREGAVGAEEWHRIATGAVRKTGTYSITHTFIVAGDANIRVVVRGDNLNSTGISETLSYEISQAQNPDLTIESSANPISYGQPATIHGTIAETANTPVTLLARTRQQSKFVAISTAISTGGVYTFPAQTPLQSTFYEVTGAGKASAPLFEGVKYGLTSSVPPSTVQAGQPLTFAGTVTPGHEGHAVYLQVQNSSGTGFHNLEVGTVTSASTYVIQHTPFIPGTWKFRVKVPGDPQNQGVSGPLSTVVVTPAPPAALRPEAPGNSSAPSEGQV